MIENNEKLRRLQERELVLVKEFLRICQENDLTYYAAFGTLIGAVRHKGFIPWDDDIDIWMPRPDYEKFLRIAPDLLPAQYRVETYATCENDEVYTARIVDTTTKVRVHTAIEPVEECMWMDIWALDGVPSGKLAYQIHKFRFLFRRMMVQISAYKQVIHQYRKGRPWYERAIMAVCEHIDFGKIINTKKAKGRAEKLMQKYGYEDSELVLTYWASQKFGGVVRREWYREYLEVPFEDITLRIPADYDKILTKVYGEYMKVPPEEEWDLQHKMEIVEI